MFPGAQEFKHKVLWICKPGETDVMFTVLRPVIYLRPAVNDQPVEWKIQFSIPKADQERFDGFLGECNQKFRFVFESPWALYEGEGLIESGPKPYIAGPSSGDSGLTRIRDLSESERLERTTARSR